MNERKKIKKIGIRATAPNQIWHIDVTVINLRPGKKFYIQSVIDNYSRFVLAWNVTDSINAINTIQTLNLAKKKTLSVQEGEHPIVMMDPGSENRNLTVSEYIASANLRRLIARVEIHYSNSMIESLFKSLKNNYLYHQGVRTIEDLNRKATFYFRQYNEVVPHAVLKGGIPSEVYHSLWTKEAQDELQKMKSKAMTYRKLQNIVPPCGTCVG